MTGYAIDAACGFSAVAFVFEVLTLLFKEQPPSHRVINFIIAAFHGSVVYGLWPLAWGGAA